MRPSVSEARCSVNRKGLSPLPALTLPRVVCLEPRLSGNGPCCSQDVIKPLLYGRAVVKKETIGTPSHSSQGKLMNASNDPQTMSNQPTGSWGAVRPMPVNDLLLDPNNPRLPTFKEIQSQETLVAWMVKKHAIGELMASFSISGYFEEEPLVGVPSATERGKVVIVEGNRRLAALRLLLDPTLTTSLNDPETGRRLTVRVPETSARTLQNLTHVPVRLYTHRSDVLAYIGYRHITGIRPWDSYSKARYVAELVEQGGNLPDIQKQIGDRHETAPRLYRAYLVWGQAGDHGWLDRNGATPPFSYLFTALTFRPILLYIGLSSQGLPMPVEDNRLPQLKELTTYLYGNKNTEREPAIEESREIKDLAQALASPSGRKQLETGAKVSEALDAIPAEVARLERLIRQAIDRLIQARILAPRHRDNEGIRELARSCAESARNLSRLFTGK